MVTDMLGTPVVPGCFVKHLPTGKIYKVQRTSTEDYYGEHVDKVRVYKTTYSYMSLTTKNIVRCLPSGKIVVDGSSVIVIT